MASAPDELPSFLFGTFDWLIDGITIRERPPLDLLSQAALEHDNPWVVLAAVIERGKRGDHEHAQRLAAFYDSRTYALDRVALLITGMLAKSEHLRLLEDALRSRSSTTRSFAAGGAREAGLLRLVPAMLRAWQIADHWKERSSIAHAICDLLESPAGPLLSESVHYNSPPADPAILVDPKIRAFADAKNARPLDLEQFPALVRARCAALEATHRTREVCLWAGEPRHPRRIAQAMWDALPEAVSSFDLIHYRRTFEASTGIPCGEFFEYDRPKRLRIQVTLQDFMLLEEDGFVAGERYFAGHRVP